jgi:hypothetical protein
MEVYIILDQYYEDVEVLAVFSTEEKANNYKEFMDKERMAGIRTIKKAEVDVETTFEEDEELLDEISRPSTHTRI